MIHDSRRRYDYRICARVHISQVTFGMGVRSVVPDNRVAYMRDFHRIISNSV